MFLVAGAILGVFGVASFVFVATVAFGGGFAKLDGLEYWLEIGGALFRNALLVAAGYTALVEPRLAPSFAWAALGIYVLLAVGGVIIRTGSFRVSDLISTFYITLFVNATCAAALTLFQPIDA
jgi:hypothetical protein